MVLSSLLACSTIHNHLVESQLRTKIGIVIETGEAREVHHHCLLFGYGADAVNPYLAYESLFQSLKDGSLKTRISLMNCQLQMPTRQVRKKEY